MKQVLLIEDNDEFRAAAEKANDPYNPNRVKIPAVAFTRSYEGAIYSLDEAKRVNVPYSGIVTDIFFPRSDNSTDITLGLSLLNKLCPNYNSEGPYVSFLKQKGVFEHLSEHSQRYALGIDETGKAESNPIVLATKQILSTFNPDGKHQEGTKLVAGILNNTFGMTHNVPSGKGNKFYGLSLERAIREDPSNQPLGVLIGEEAKARNIPVIFVTSTFHHDNLTQPIVNYIYENKLGTILDCPRENPQYKANPEFWINAFKEIKDAMGSEE